MVVEGMKNGYSIISELCFLLACNIGRMLMRKLKESMFACSFASWWQMAPIVSKDELKGTTELIYTPFITVIAPVLLLMIHHKTNEEIVRRENASFRTNLARDGSLCHQSCWANVTEETSQKLSSEGGVWCTCNMYSVYPEKNMVIY